MAQYSEADIQWEQDPENPTVEQPEVLSGAGSYTESDIVWDNPTNEETMMDKIAGVAQDAILAPLDPRTHIGMAEAVVGITSDFLGAQLPAALGSMVTTGINAPLDPEVDFVKAYPEVFQDTAQSFANNVAYEPRTATGQKYTDVLHGLFEGIRKVGQTMGDAWNERANAQYLDIKEKLATGELDPESAVGMLMNTHAELMNVVGPTIASAVNVSPEAALMLLPAAKRLTRTETKKPTPTVESMEKIVPNNPKVTISNRATIVREDIAQYKARADEVAKYMEETPLAKGRTWVDEVASLEKIRLETIRSINLEKGEVLKDAKQIMLEDIEVRLSMARLARVREANKAHEQHIENIAQRQAEVLAKEKGVPVEQELARIKEDIVIRLEEPIAERTKFGQDYRTPEELHNDVFRITELGDGKAAVAPRYSDITPRQELVAGNVLAGKQMGELNPIIKWGVDKYNEAYYAQSMLLEKYLYDSTLTEGKGLTALRGVKSKKGENGAFTILEEIGSKNKHELGRIRKALIDAELEHPFKEAPDSYFLERGISQRGIEGVRALRGKLEQLRQYLNKQIEFYNLNRGEGTVPMKSIENMPNYIGHTWFGDFRVFVRKGKNVEQVLGANNKLQAKRIAKRLEKEGYDVSISRRTNELGQDAQAREAFSHAIKLLGENTASAEKIRNLYGESLSRGGFMAHARLRKGRKGFAGSEEAAGANTNFFKGQKALFESSLKYGEFLKTNTEVSKVLSDPNMAKSYPNSLTYLNRYKNNFMEKQGTVSRTIDKGLATMTNDWITGNDLRTTIGHVNNYTLHQALFFGNIRFLGAQALQPHLVVVPKLMQLKTKHGMRGSVIAADLKSTKDSIAPSKEAKRAIRWAYKHKVIDPNFIEQFSKDIGRGYHGKGAMAREYITGRRAAAWMEENTRMKSFLTFYHFLKDSGRSEKIATEEAGYLTRKYMVEYHTGERPMIYGEAGLGTIGKTSGLFKTWMHNYIGQGYEYIRDLKVTDPKSAAPLASYMGMQVFMGGLKGVIGVGAADQVLDSLGFTTITDYLLKSGKGDTLVYGIPSGATEYSFHDTTAAPGLVPSEMFSFPSLEFSVEVAAAAYGLASARIMARGDDLTRLEEMRLWKAIAPGTIDGWIEAAYTKPGGPVPDPKKKGRGTIPRDTKDWIARMTGGRSLKERRWLDTMWQVQRLEQNSEANVDTLTGLGAQALSILDDIPDWMYEKGIEFGVSPHDFRDRAFRRKKLIDSNMLERRTKLGKTKKGRETLRTIEEYGFDGLTGEYKEPGSE